MSRPDILDLLLPDAAREDRERARRLTTALRLFAHAGRGARAEDVESSVDAARLELAAVARKRREAALAALLHHHLAAHQDPGAFLLWGPPPPPREAAWRAVLEEGGEEPALPAPGEAPLSVAARLLDALARLDPDGRETAVWSARLKAAGEGPAAGEAAFRALLGMARVHAARRAAVAGVASTLLERGRVGEARAWLSQHLDLASVDEELAWHLAWCELLLGDEAAARATVRGLDPYRGVLPRALAALRRRRPAWIPFLPGREPPAGGLPARPAAGRGDLGAGVLAVFALGPANAALPVQVDVGAALRRGAERWARERDGAAADLAAPEHALVASAAVLVRHRSGPALVGCLDPGTLAHALVPVLYGHGPLEGEVAGWVALEFPHHLVPAEERLAAVAEAWRGPVLEAAWERRGRAAEAPPALVPVRGVSAAGLARDDPRALAVQAFVEALGMKTQTRRWWFFDAGREGRRLIAEGGSALPDREARPGRGSALSRAHAAGGAVHFEAPDARLALHGEAASGLVLPVRGPRGVEGLLAVESTRQRDFRAADRARLARAASLFHDAWVAARFAGWHRERFRELIHADARVGLPLPVADALGAGRARMSAAVAGPPGSGRRIVARWLHHEGAGAEAPLREVALAGGGLPPAGEEATWIVLDLERAPPEAQAALLLRLEGEGPRVLALLARPPAPGAGSRLVPEVASRLARLVVAVPALSERRNAIPGLADVLARRVAAAEGLQAPGFSDAALALLWRQAWPGNVRELEQLVARLVLLFPGAELGEREVGEAAQRLGLRLAARLASRHPLRRDVVDALRWTRCSTGATNKTRAAAYLGWDPDTLVARLADLRLDPEDPLGPDPS